MPRQMLLFLTIVQVPCGSISSPARAVFLLLLDTVSCSESEKGDRVSLGNKSSLYFCVSNTEPQNYASTEERSSSDRDNFLSSLAQLP